MNINTKEYWEKRFETGDWESKMGTQQTIDFAKSIIHFLKIQPNFSGTILDFGCGLGDAIPIYKINYKHASLIGVDIAEVAIMKCKQKYGEIANFISCDYLHVPNVDVIISSNVFEHLSNQKEVAKHLLTKCENLYIIVPYKEIITTDGEHINSYDENSFSEFGEYNYAIFCSKGWSEFGWNLWFNVYFKNMVRPLFGRKIIIRKKQIMFHFKNTARNK